MLCKLFDYCKKRGYKWMLFIDKDFPAFDKNAGNFITMEYLKVFLDLGYKIVYWSHEERYRAYAEKLEQMGMSVNDESQNFNEFIKRNGKYLDLAVISRPNIAEYYLPLVKKFSMTKIFYLPQDLHFLRESRWSKISGDENMNRKSEITKKLEISLMRQCEATLFFSGEEVQIVNALDRKIKTVVIPWIQPIPNGQQQIAFNDREGLLFLGGFSHEPNIDGVFWFYKEILPVIKKTIPKIKIIILGSNMPSEILNLDSDNFKVIGFVEEEKLPDYFNSAKVFLAPLRYGAGFKGKIARAMAFGLPVVTTSIGAEGIGLINRENGMITDDSEEFAKKVIELHKNRDIWDKISKNSLDYVSKNFSAENARNKIASLQNELGI